MRFVLRDGVLFLLLMPSEARWWRFKYRFNGVEKQLSLGVYPDMPLKRARERLEAARRLVADGIDPAARRQEEKRTRAQTFEAVAREWMAQRTDTWSAEYARTSAAASSRTSFPGSARSLSARCMRRMCSIACGASRSAGRSRPRIACAPTEPAKVGELLRAIDGYRCKSIVVSCALRLAPLVFVRPASAATRVRSARTR